MPYNQDMDETKQRGRPKLPDNQVRRRRTYTLPQSAIEALDTIRRPAEPRSIAIERIIMEAREARERSNPGR